MFFRDYIPKSKNQLLGINKNYAEKLPFTIHRSQFTLHYSLQKSQLQLCFFCHHFPVPGWVKS